MQCILDRNFSRNILKLTNLLRKRERKREKKEKKTFSTKNKPVKIFYNPLAAFYFGSGAFGHGGV